MDSIIDSLQPAKAHRTSKQIGRAIARGKINLLFNFQIKTIANIRNSFVSFRRNFRVINSLSSPELSPLR